MGASFSQPSTPQDEPAATPEEEQARVFEYMFAQSPFLVHD